jgi:hydroxymethylpyrimidine/phosphomethylpyrimidine kinase
MIPEVGMNLGYAVPLATSPDDVCSIIGRLTREGERFRADRVDFGASKHIATIILTAIRFDPETRCALNLKYDEKIVSHASKVGLRVSSFNREDEPGGSSTMEWGVESVIRSGKGVPDMIYDLGSVGKEPMIRVLGKNPEDVLGKVKKVLEVIG